MRIGELAQRTGTTPKAIRLYESRGLLGTVARAGSYRHYGEADVARVQADVARASDDLNRRKPLVASGAVGGEEMKHIESALASSRSALAGAQSALAAAQEQANSNRALTDGVAVAELARHNGLPRLVLVDLLRGRLRGHRGQAHNAAIVLGLKPEPEATH